MIEKIKIIFRNCILFFLFLFFFSNFSSAGNLTANAGNNTGVCPGDSVKIGGNPSASGGLPPYTYSWQPSASLSNPTIANPYAFPTALTNYTLTVTDGAGKTSVSSVSVTVYSLPKVTVGPNQTILEGNTTTLSASGCVNYFWTPTSTLYNQNTATPTAYPSDSTKYCVVGVDAHGCTGYACTKVFVIPSDELVLYNAFTPNSDGNNDEFYIGNIEKYPLCHLEVFNRNGRLVYTASPYHNDWNGKVDGVELPCATYYFVLDLGVQGKDKVSGSVTIIR